MTRVGFVGAGRMGGPMVRRLVESGHDVQALGRSDQACRSIRELGARPVTTLADVSDGAEVVIVCVFTDDQVQQVCLQGELVSAMPPGSVLVIHTTGSPSTAEAIAAQSPGIDVIDAPVSGGPHDIAAGHVTLFVGGSDEAVTRAQPVIASYGDPILHVGPIGAGQRVKLINNTLFAAQIGLLRAAVELGGRLGVEESKLLASVPHGSGASRVGEFIAPRGSVQAFVDGVGEFIGKDVAVARKIAAELGSDLGLLDDVINAGLEA
ncbi:MAG TPA: NAD(P)-dependent oxidoreductase [Mycobacterium sp.]|nr:NAD(P)-dependent oxidoreductase [Mycobacterium sp.]